MADSFQLKAIITAVDKVSAPLKGMQRQLKGFKKEFASLSLGAAGAGTAVLGALALPVKSAIALESKMADVRKVVDGLDTELIGNVIRKVEICRNRLYEVDDCFTFYGVQLEGRRVDVRLGIPPRTMRWLPLLKDPAARTCVARDNRIEDVVCSDNDCRQYKYKYKIAGVRAGGHATAIGNGVEQDLVLENNRFEDGEGHILVEDQIIWDWVEASGNYTAGRYRE